MKIVYVITGLGLGGAENIVVNLADRASNEGHEVYIIYLTGSVIVVPTNNKIPLISLNMTRFSSFLSSFNFFCKKIKEINPDVIHSHMFHANILSRLLKIKIKTPKLICTAHNTNEGGVLRMLVYRVTDKFAFINTNVSEEAVESFEKKQAVRKGRMLTITNGIDTEKFIKKPKNHIASLKDFPSNNCFSILSVGRLDYQKDYPNLFHALHYLKNEGIRFHLSLVGVGVLSDTLKSLSKELNIFDDITWLGARSDIPDLMNLCDVFVLPSLYEGFGLVVAEAMACEQVVVATDCGGVAQLLGDQDFLVPPQDPVALANKIKWVMSFSEDKRCDVGSKFRKRVIEHFSFEKMYSSYMNLYKSPHDEIYK